MVYNAAMKQFLSVYAALSHHNFNDRLSLTYYLHEQAWALLAAALQAECGIALSSLTVTHNAHGKPSFADSPLQFNLSHCSMGETALVCCALSNAPVGIDCAAVRPYDDRLAHRICTEHEYNTLVNSADPATELMTLWTQKESYRKLTGEGLSGGLRVEAPAQPNTCLHTYQFDGFLVTLCTERNFAPPKLTLL